MKAKILSVVISSLLVVSGANAAEIFNKGGNKIDLKGELHGGYYFARQNAEIDNGAGDNSYVRLGVDGETQITDKLTGHGKWEYEFDSTSPESNASGSHMRIAFAGLSYGNLGSLDYGRDFGVVYDITSWTDILPEFGSDGFPNGTYATDNFMQNRGNGMLTYRNNDFFGQVDGLTFALQYQTANNHDEAIEANGDGFAAAVSYDTDIGISIGGALSTSRRLDKQQANGKDLLYGTGDKAETYTAGIKYDKNDVYVGLHYTQTYNATLIGDKGFANKADNLEVAAKYSFDFGLTPSVAYLQSKGHNLKNHSNDKDEGNQDLLKYVDIALNYDFNENFLVYVDYKINLLKENDFNKNAEIPTDNIVALGVSYQF